MAEITITCPITWFIQCEWIKNNCVDWVCNTNWQAWSIGIEGEDIHFSLREEDAVIFKLMWGC